jgi:hypothetical protein
VIRDLGPRPVQLRRREYALLHLAAGGRDADGIGCNGVLPEFLSAVHDLLVI